MHSSFHFTQSSTRTTTAPTSALASHEHSFNSSYARSSTPPRIHPLSQSSDLRSQPSSHTPKSQGRPAGTPQPPSDSEAADLMLFLATSPSPARPTVAKTSSLHHRTLSGSSALQGRVLFPGQGGGASDEKSTGGNRPLKRDYTGSFSSTLSVATEPSSDGGFPLGGSQERIVGIPVGPSSPTRPFANHTHLGVPQMPTVTPPTPTDNTYSHNIPTQPPQSPIRAPASSSLHRQHTEPSLASPDSSRGVMAAPPTPGNAFNFTDFLNVTPSPAVAPKPSGNLRADVGRRLFEEHHHTMKGSHGPGNPLGASIDLMNS